MPDGSRCRYFGVGKKSSDADDRFSLAGSRKGERTVGELEEIVGLSQSALSQHLARLRRSDIVKTRREAQTIHYSIADPGVTKVIGALYDLYCGQVAVAGLKGQGND